jgi:hypothetical protein
VNGLGHNSELTAPAERIIVLPEANSGLPLKGLERMARKRFQRGQLILRGKRRPVWVGRWREDIIKDGKVQRVEKWEILGTKQDYPTRKLALRALEEKLSGINNALNVALVVGGSIVIPHMRRAYELLTELYD